MITATLINTNSEKSRNFQTEKECSELQELVPVRMLTQFSYCQRLGYLEWVQGEWDTNLETKEGTFGHRNVDKNNKKEFHPDDEIQETIHAQSVMLSAEAEGLIGKIDLLQIEKSNAVPVEYKRGKVPNNPESSYLDHRVQLAAQALILRDNGYSCNEGVIYYIASNKRVTIPIDDELIKTTRLLLREMRFAATAGIPTPLEDSQKCPRCSLVGICLPDETNLLSRDETCKEAKDGLRRLTPARKNSIPLYVQTQGAFVGKSGERLNIKFKGEVLQEVRMIDVSQLVLFGSVMISAQAIAELMKRNIPICHLSYGGWLNGITTGLAHKNVELRLRQFEVAKTPDAALAIAKRFVIGKIKNARTLLRRHLDGECTNVKKKPLLKKLEFYARKADAAENMQSLLGIEGVAAKEYFSGFFSLLPKWIEPDILTRNRRPPADAANAVLSFLYALLTKEMNVAAQSVGFDPLLGFYHQPRFGKPALALDLMEEFRSIVADSSALRLFNNKEVTKEDFIARGGAVAMKDTARKSVIAAYERRMQMEITHPIFGYKITYRRVLEVQMRLLARHLLGELPEYPYFYTR